MRKNLLGAAIVLITCLCAGGRAQAGTIAINLFPASPLNIQNSPMIVDVVVSGLTGLNVPSVGAFDVTLYYDAAVLSALTPTYGDSNGDMVDLTGCGALCQTVTYLPGSIEISQVSLATDAQLKAAQPSTFTLVQVPFNVLVPLPVSTTVSLTTNYLVSGTGTEIISPPASVPEPQTWILGAAGLLALAFCRRRREA